MDVYVSSPVTTTRHAWVPAVGALAGTALTVKAALIIGSGNGVGDQPMAVLYLAGIAVGIVAAVGLGLRRRPLWQRIVVGVAAPLLLVLWILGLGEVLNPIAELFSNEAYVGDELPVGVAGLVLLATSLIGYRADESGRVGQP